MKLSGLGPSSSASDGSVQTVHVVRRPPKVQVRSDTGKLPESDAFDIVWSIGKEVFVGAAGPDAKGAYAALQKADAGRTLARDPFLAKTIERLGPRVSFALFVDMARLSDVARPDAEGSALVLTYGKDARNQAWFELDAPSTIVATYATLLAGGR